ANGKSTRASGCSSIVLNVNAPRLAVIAVLLGCVAIGLSQSGLMRTDEPSRNADRSAKEAVGPAAPNRAERADAANAERADATSTAAAVGRAAAIEPTRETGTPRTGIGARVELRVYAPSDVAVGDVFQAEVHVRADEPMRELMFAIAFDKSRLALVGSSAGNF